MTMSPSISRSPEHSWRDLRESIATEGAVSIPGFLEPSSVLALRDAAVRLAQSCHAQHCPKSTRVIELYRYGPKFVDLLTSGKLSALLSELLGPNAVLYDYSLNVVHPGQPQDEWHVDFPYNHMHTRVGDGLLAIQCVLPLDPFTSENGATQYVRGSHRRRRMPEPEMTTSAALRRILHADAGTLLVMSTATWHRAGRNKSNEARRAVILTFAQQWIRPLFPPPEPGPWSHTEDLRVLLGMELPSTDVRRRIEEARARASTRSQ